MIELPEAYVLASQVSKTFSGKRIKKVVAGQSPHKFAWFFGDPKNYESLLQGKIIIDAVSIGGLVEIEANDAILLFGDGVNLRYYDKDSMLPPKHQLYVEFEDKSSLIGSVQMYGGLWAFPKDSFDNKYYKISKEKISPFKQEFDYDYFNALIDEKTEKLSLKAFLATEQRVPGLGNGVLQDILFNAKLHPKKKVNTLSIEDKKELFNSLKSTLAMMTGLGGRDTETDLYGKQGGYTTIFSRNTVGKPCKICGTTIKKEAYMGGSIYYCPKCQKT
ncbi:endonuclease VIII [Candidatus Bathyarchaeota archaeon]|nr:endonuclease VIII [Candidatus Bathyarchaeota archaeon]